MSQFVLVKDLESGRVRKIATNSLIPEGTEIAGAYFNEDNAIAVCVEAGEWFDKAEGIGRWALGPARFVYAKTGIHVVRLGRIGEYRPAPDEYPVAEVHGIDVLGLMLTYSAVEGLDVETLVFLDLLERGRIRVD